MRHGDDTGVDKIIIVITIKCDDQPDKDMSGAAVSFIYLSTTYTGASSCLLQP